MRIYGAEYRGVVNYYLLAQDVWRLHTLCWHAETSMLKTLAAKHKSTVTKMAARFKAKVTTGGGPRTCFKARRRREDKPDLVARFGGIILQQDRQAVIRDPAPVPVPACPAQGAGLPAPQAVVRAVRDRHHGGSPPGRRAHPARETGAGPARVGLAHGKNAAQDARRLRAVPWLHPREPRRARGINRWRARCADRRTPGFVGRLHGKGPGSPRRTRDLPLQLTLLITKADEQAIALLPAGAWKPGIAQDGTVEEDKDVAEITRLMSRAGNWPGGLRWIARRVKPSRRQMKNLTGYEKKTGWRYSITCTNIPDTGIEGVPGSHHPQYIDAVHREHACVETAGVRTAKAMGLRALPSKTWQVNAWWVIAANIAADLAAWTRLLGHCDDADLREADPDTLRPGSGTCPPATPGSELSPSAPTGHGPTPSSPAGSASAPCPHPPDQHEPPQRHGRRNTRRGRSRCAPGHPGNPAHPPPQGQTDMRPKNGYQHNQ